MGNSKILLGTEIVMYLIAFVLTAINLYVLNKEHIKAKYGYIYWMSVVQAIFFGLWVLDTMKIYAEVELIGEADDDDIPFVLDFFGSLNMFASSVLSMIAYGRTIKQDTEVSPRLKNLFISNSVIFLIVSIVRLSKNKHVRKTYKAMTK